MAKVEINVEDEEESLTVRYWTDLPEGAPGTPATKFAFSLFALIEAKTGLKFEFRDRE